MGVIKLRTSQFDRSVRLLPHCAPDILDLRLAHVDVIMAALMNCRFGRDVWQRLAVDRNVQNLKIPVLLFHDRRDREVVFDESLTVSQVWSNAHHNTFILLLKNQ